MATALALVDDDGPDNEAAETNAAQLDEVHARAMERFADIAAATQEQRLLSLTARRFVSIPGAQWEGDGWSDLGENTIRVEINKTARGLEKIVNDYRANRLTVTFRAVGSKSSEETAETLEGLHRADAYHHKAQQARDNAFEEAAAGGFGAYRLAATYTDEYDPDDDTQRINPGLAIVDADQRVFFDLNSKLYDKSDAQFAFVVTAMTRQAYEREYPGFVSSWPEGVFKPFWDWFRPDTCLVAEYYEIEETSAKRLTYTHKLSGDVERFWQSEISTKARADMLTQGYALTSARMVKRRCVHKYTLSGAEVLNDDGRIAGDCIPIVPVYGKRWFVDDMERWRGHVQLAMDPQRIYNLQISKLSEIAALTPREVPIFTPEQVAGHEQRWANMNIERHPYALINPIIGPDGAPMSTGPVSSVQPPQLAPVTAALIQITANDIQELTTADDGADQTKSNVSAQAMEIAATRVDAKSAAYMDNMRQSVQREGEIYLSMARDAYFEPGREVEVMDGDGMSDTATLAEPATDPTTGKFSIRNDLSRGRYSVVSDVTEASATRRDKTVRACLNIAEVATAAQQVDLAGAAILTAMLNMDGVGMDDFQAWGRTKALAIGLVKPTDAEKQEMAQAAQNQQPDPSAAVAAAQAAALQAVAAKDGAMAGKIGADTKQSEAKTLQILHDTHAKLEDAQHGDAHHAADIAQKHADVTATHAGTLATLTGAAGEHAARFKVSHDVANAQAPSAPLIQAETLRQ